MRNKKQAMYIYKDKAKELLHEFAVDLDEELKSKTDFMFALAEDDDWSLVIKSHALIESLVTELLVAKTEEVQLKSIIERLPLSDEEIGKLRIAKDYNVLTKHERRFIKRFSALRNDLVHKFENVNFEFEKYVINLDKGQKDAWRVAFTWFEQGKSVEKSWSEATINNPKMAVWLAVLMFVSQIVLRIVDLKSQTKLSETERETSRMLLSNGA